MTTTAPPFIPGETGAGAGAAVACAAPTSCARIVLTPGPAAHASDVVTTRVCVVVVRTVLGTVTVAVRVVGTVRVRVPPK